MKFKVNSYHFKLLRDYERLSVFKEAIDEFAKERLNSNKNQYINSNGLNNSNLNLAYDLGSGSGVLSYLAKYYFNKIISIEIDPNVSRLTKENLNSFNNIEVYNEDILNFNFSQHEKADLIICEMLDTALIDEEQVPVLNYAKNYLKEDGIIIPNGIINSAEPVFMNNHYLQYEDDEYSPIYNTLGKPVIYSQFNFLDNIEENFSTIIGLEINNIKRDKRLDNFNHDKNKIILNGIKITSFTKLNENIICGPTPMLNPAMLIPIEETEVNIGDKIKIKLDYVMGGGVETIKTEILD